jgi:hypothetical protein
MKSGLGVVGGDVRRTDLVGGPGATFASGEAAAE